MKTKEEIEEAIRLLGTAEECFLKSQDWQRYEILVMQRDALRWALDNPAKPFANYLLELRNAEAEFKL